MNSTTNTASTAPLLPMADPNPQPYEAVRFNALKHGILSRYTVLSHENHADYESLVNSLMDEHLPAGATEQHLIEELASIIWRKRRVLQAEGATINQDLKSVACNAKAVMQAAAPFQRGIYSQTIDLGEVIDLSQDDVIERQRAARLDMESLQKVLSLELTRFDGHLIVKSRRSPDESQPQSQTAVSTAVSQADGRIGWRRQKAQRAGQRIWLS